jgi:hypothetical protein
MYLYLGTVNVLLFGSVNVPLFLDTNLHGLCLNLCCQTLSVQNQWKCCISFHFNIRGFSEA